jgi:hypothetical protein
MKELVVGDSDHLAMALDHFMAAVNLDLLKDFGMDFGTISDKSIWTSAKI